MGCARNTLAGIGCLALVAVTVVAGYQYRGPLGRVLKRGAAAFGNSADTVRTTGTPSADALRRARVKEAALARADGPDEVTVTAEEMAALVMDGLHPAARAALDSLSVTLAPGRLTLDALVRTDRLGVAVLGPLSGVVNEREPLRMAGSADVGQPGEVLWRPDEFRVRGVQFPASLVPRVVDALTGGHGGTVPIPVPPTTGRMEINGDGVTFYRRTD
jgi:hypothetical protein